MRPKKVRRSKKKKYIKHTRNRFAGCIVGSGNVVSCNVCLSNRRCGRTKQATEYDVKMKNQIII